MSRNAKFTSQKMINDKDQFMLLRPFFQGFLNVKEHVPRAFFFKKMKLSK